MCLGPGLGRGAQAEDARRAVPAESAGPTEVKGRTPRRARASAGQEKGQQRGPRSERGWQAGCTEPTEEKKAARRRRCGGQPLLNGGRSSSTQGSVGCCHYYAHFTDTQTTGRSRKRLGRRRAAREPQSRRVQADRLPSGVLCSTRTGEGSHLQGKGQVKVEQVSLLQGSELLTHERDV